MPIWLITALEMIVFALVILVIYNLFKVYVMSKIKANKWIVLISAFAVFFIPVFVRINLPWNMWTYIPSGIFVILLLWFMDLSGFGVRKYENKNKKNEIIMKPKAKPNRIRNK